MRIGIDARFYTPAFTGIGRYVYELIDNLLKIDRHNHYVLFFNNPQFQNFPLRQKNAEKILVDCKHYSFSEQWRFWRILEKANLDLMHFTHFNAPILYRKPNIVTIHDLTISLYPGNKMNSWWKKLAYHLTINSVVKRAKRVIAVSKHTKKDIIRLLRVDPEKISVIHEGVNKQFHQISDNRIVEEFKKHMGLTHRYILYTGVWRSHKNLVNLIKAFAILKRAYKFDGWLVITGNEDPWYPEVKETVKREKLEGSVHFTGLVPEEDIVLLYNGALVYVLPSLYEGFGLPVLEAFACGVPVCASTAACLPEICGKAAALFDPHNPADMARQIAAVYTNPAKMNELVSLGYERLKDFSWHRMAEETLALYNTYVKTYF